MSKAINLVLPIVATFSNSSAPRNLSRMSPVMMFINGLNVVKWI